MIEQLDDVRSVLAQRGGGWGAPEVADALSERGYVVSDSLVLALMEELRRSSTGAGILDPLLAIPGVTDVLVNGPNQVFIDRGAGLELTDVTFGSDEDVRKLATRLAAAVGRRLDDASPWVDARLADGTRLHAVLSCLSAPGTCISLRVPGKGGMTMEQFRESRSFDARLEGVLRALIAKRIAFLVTGGTGSGKTTLLGCLLGLVRPDERLVIVEDSRELQPHHPHVVQLEGRPANAEGAGAVTMTDLVRQALRMRPDRLILGEARGAELCDLLTAMNTGHEGGCATLHANSVSDVPARLEALAALGGMGREALHAQAGAALKVVIHVKRWPSGHRGVAQIGVVRKVDGWVRIDPALSADEEGISRQEDSVDVLQQVIA